MKKRYFYYIPFIILFLIILNTHLNMCLMTDDICFYEKSYSNSLIFMISRYNEWTSRNLIELVLTKAVQNFFLWQIIDSAIFAGIAILITKILNKKDKLIYSVITSCLILLFYYISLYALGSSGYVSSTINYIWPLFTILANIYLTKYLIEKQISNKLKKAIIYLISIILLIFGVNNEQYCAILLLAYIVLFIYLKYKKIQIPKILYLNLLIIIISTINVLICPGNSNRFYVEQSERFPEYVTTTFFDKINIGFSHFLNRVTSHCDIITLILMFLLGIYSYIKNKISIKTVVCFIPFIVGFTCWILLQLNYGDVSALLDSNLGQFGFYTVSNKRTVFDLIFYLSVILTTLYGFYQVYKYNKKLGAITFSLFIISVLSVIMYGFTPSIPSLERMYILFYFINLIIDYILILNLIKILKNKV